MRIRLDNISSTLWLFFLWVMAAAWIADVLAIRRPWIWLYMGGHGVALYFVNKVKGRLARGDLLNRSLLRIRLSTARRGVLVLIGVLWVMEFLVLLKYSPFLLTETYWAIPFLLLCVPVLVAVTALEVIWTKRPEP